MCVHVLRACVRVCRAGRFLQPTISLCVSVIVALIICEATYRHSSSSNNNNDDNDDDHDDDAVIKKTGTR